MEDKSLYFFNDISLATSSGNETVATHTSTVLTLPGTGDTIPWKVVSGNALSGILNRYDSDLEYYLMVTTTCTSGGSATMTAALYNSSSSTLASGNVELDRHGGSAIAVASLVQGAVLLSGSLIGKKLASPYLGMQYVIATAALTAGVLRGVLGQGVAFRRAAWKGLTKP